MEPLEHPSNMPHPVKLREDQAAQERPVAKVDHPVQEVTVVLEETAALLAKVAQLGKEHLARKVVRMSPEAAHRTQDDLVRQVLTA
jgi:hypothetical protein